MFVETRGEIVSYTVKMLFWGSIRSKAVQALLLRSSEVHSRKAKPVPLAPAPMMPSFGGKGATLSSEKENMTARRNGKWPCKEVPCK